MNRTKCNAYSHSLSTHEMHIHIYTQCFLLTGCDFVSTRVWILVAFFRWYSTHSVFDGLRQTHHASLRSTLSFAPRALIFVHTVTGASLALCHFLPRTVLCTSLTPCCQNLCCSGLVSRSHSVHWHALLYLFYPTHHNVTCFSVLLLVCTESSSLL